MHRCCLFLVALVATPSLAAGCGDGDNGDPCGDRIVDLSWVKKISSCEETLLIPQQLIFDEEGKLTAAGGCAAGDNTRLRDTDGVCSLTVDVVCPHPKSETTVSFVVSDLEESPVTVNGTVQVFAICTDSYDVTVEL